MDVSNKNEQLLQASYKGDAKAIQLLVDKGANIDATLMVLMEQVQRGGDTPQMLEPIEALLKAGVSLKDDILFYADCYPNLIKLLLKYGADANYREEDGYSVLHRMSSFGGKYCEDALKILIKAGADVNARTDNGKTPLMMIAYSYPDEEDSPEGFITILLEAGANIDAKNNDGKTVLDLAKDENNINVVNILKKVLNKKNNELLIKAIKEGDSKHVKKLIDAGADVNVLYDYGYPLIYAIEYQHINIVKMLIDAGADPLLESDGGDTALDYAKLEDNKQINEILSVYITVRKSTEPINNDVKCDIDFNKKIMDFISLEENVVADYLKENKDNIVIVDEKQNYTLSSKSNIKKALSDPNYQYYACKGVLDVLDVRGKYIDDVIYFKLQIIGVMTGEVVPFNDMLAIVTGNQQIVKIMNTNLRLPAMVSLRVVDGGSLVSASHCQAGTEHKIARIVACNINISNQSKSLSRKNNPESMFYFTPKKSRRKSRKRRSKSKRKSKSPKRRKSRKRISKSKRKSKSPKRRKSRKRRSKRKSRKRR